ncbi:uncharacterized protein LOC129592262 [Paramacrobiotus metropolitanus]|uniref:uncharacterized protein LOC129592262 n=1 Tax=Paramacrobiotus metropolitanus TaxID=2943436 RepID=UPI002446576E|nr:uncharacterized protein LOC129592262 [Paramacrobiotus metropolitanus]
MHCILRTLLLSVVAASLAYALTDLSGLAFGGYGNTATGYGNTGAGWGAASPLTSYQQNSGWSQPQVQLQPVQLYTPKIQYNLHPVTMYQPEYNVRYKPVQMYTPYQAQYSGWGGSQTPITQTQAAIHVPVAHTAAQTADLSVPHAAVPVVHTTPDLSVPNVNAHTVNIPNTQTFANAAGVPNVAYN